MATLASPNWYVRSPAAPMGPYSLARCLAAEALGARLAAYSSPPVRRDWRSARTVALAVLTAAAPVILHFALALIP